MNRLRLPNPEKQEMRGDPAWDWSLRGAGDGGELKLTLPLDHGPGFLSAGASEQDGDGERVEREQASEQDEWLLIREMRGDETDVFFDETSKTNGFSQK
ncbi:hypothetical protein NL676_006072 [Syzygium grande]|nr:hypothetical protein NL676_006072 [Syzygium grande]